MSGLSTQLQRPRCSGDSLRLWFESMARHGRLLHLLQRETGPLSCCRIVARCPRGPPARRLRRLDSQSKRGAWLPTAPVASRSRFVRRLVVPYLRLGLLSRGRNRKRLRNASAYVRPRRIPSPRVHAPLVGAPRGFCVAPL